MILSQVVKAGALKGLVFDKDGTLFDFNGTWGAWSAELIRAEAGGDAAVAEKLAEVLGYDLEALAFRPGSVVIAHTIDEVADAILSVVPGEKPALIARMIAAVETVPQVPVTDLVATMARLNAMGFTLGVATNDAEAPARAHLAQAGVTEAFSLILGYDSGHGAKPAPGQLRAFCAHARLAPAECAMVGDSVHDLAAGQAAGMWTIGVLTGPAPRAELAPHADVVLDDVGQLPGWLGG